MSNQVGVDFLNSLLGGLAQSAQNAQQDNDVVVKANFEIRMANPRRMAPLTDAILNREEEEVRERFDEERIPLPPRTGVTAGVRMPEVTTVPSASPGPAPGPRVDSATRQTHGYRAPQRETPALLPNNGQEITDYNPIYQDQFDNYLRTRQFDEMYGAAVRGYGAPAPRTPY